MAVDVVMFAMDRRIDRRIVLAANTLMANGFSVRLFAPVHSSSEQEPDWIERVGAQSLGTHNTGLRLYRLVREHMPWLRGAMRWIAWHVTPNPERVFVALFAPILTSAVARIYIAHDLPMLPVALAASRQNGGRILLDSHELYPEQEFSDWEKRLWRKVETRLIGRADAVITVNSSIARELSRRHEIIEPTVVQNADLYQEARPRGEASRLRQALGIADAATLFLYQGGLSIGRNIETLVKAFGLVRDENAILAILGDGPALDFLQEQVRTLRLTGRVRFHPSVPQNELIEMTRGADFGVIPYSANCLNTKLCTPNKLFEFIMARIPIIATDLPEVRNIVSGYKIGLVGNTDNPADFAKFIEQALNESKSLKTSWQGGLDQAAHDLCWEREGEKYLSVVRDLAALQAE